MKRKGKQFVIIKYVHSQSVKDALKGEHNVLAIIQKDTQIQQLAEAVGFDFSPPVWSDEESEDIGF